MPGHARGRTGLGTAPAAATDLIAAAREGSVRAIARLLTRVENGGRAAAEVAAELTGSPREAAVIGITGAPGAGKSTLTAALLREFRHPRKDAAPRSVAVLAVDPSSPFSGGALLGDRVRMADYAGDPGVFIRSMSSRGSLGGLASGTPAAVDLVSALGFDVVVIETVGVGQSEVDVMHLADTVTVMMAPGMGDAVQAAKAGILEIADLLVVNKADHDGARNTARELRSMVALGAPHPPTAATGGDGAGPTGEVRDDAWQIPVLSTVASGGGRGGTGAGTEADTEEGTVEDTGKAGPRAAGRGGNGVRALADALDAHRRYLVDTGLLAERRARRARAAVQAVVVERLRQELAGPAGQEQLATAAEAVTSGRTDHHRAADRVLAWLRGGGAPEPRHT